jgi:uncharacterized protein
MPAIYSRFVPSRRRLCASEPAESPHFLTLILLLSLFLFSPAAVRAAQSPDQLKVNNYVTDFANVLSAQGRARINDLCAEIDKKTDAQIAVVTVKTLDGRPIEEYSVDLATRLGIGPKKSNRGVLILLAVNDHQYWTAVGYGLEGILPDGKVGGFGREALPLLRQNNYDGALLLMTRRVGDVIAADRGVTLTGNAPTAPRPPNTVTLPPLAEVFLLIFIIFIVFSIFRRGGGTGSRFNRGGGGWWIGPTMGGTGSRFNRGGGGWWIGPTMGGMGGWGGGGFGGAGGGGGGGFGGFGGGSFGGGGAGGSW